MSSNKASKQVISSASQITTDTPADVADRLQAQEAALVIQRARLEYHREREEEDSKINAQLSSNKYGSKHTSNSAPIEVGDVENIVRLLREDEFSEGSNADLDRLLMEDGVEIPEDEAQKTEEIEKLEIEQKHTLESYLEHLCVDYRVNWDDRKAQTAMILIEDEFPRRRDPNMRSILSTILRDRGNDGQQYVVGDWAEALGPDMSWSLDIISKVDQRIDGDGNTTYAYSLGARNALSTYDIRVPEIGLKRLFGNRPWIWQQWAFVKLEQRMRFQPNHDEDFECMNIPEFARHLWLQWLVDDKNSDFRKHLSDPRINSCQDDLFDHIMKPFYILDDIRREYGWDLSSDEFSIYTYLSLNGSGFVVCIIAMVLQVVIPSILVLSTISEIEVDPNAAFGDKIRAIFCVTDDEARCVSLQLTTYIVICIQILYMFKVVPDTGFRFQDVAGVGGYGLEKSYARIKAIRQEVLQENNDRIGQLIGSVTDMYMNTLYVYLLFTLNLINILNEANPTNVILNALALEFVYNIDEDFARTVWWDPDRRWLKAGIMETFIQSTFQFRALQSSRLFSDLYEIDRKLIEKVCDGDNSLLYDVSASRVDQGNLDFMNQSEKFEYYCKKKCSQMGVGNFDEFTKPSYVFGTFELFLYRLISTLSERFWPKSRSEGFGVFYRLQYYQTWSRWRRVLFLADIPDLDGLFEVNLSGKPIIKKSLEREKHTDDNQFDNFNEKPSIPSKTFARKRLDVLMFHELKNNFQFAVYQGDFDRSIGWLLNGSLEWLTYVVELVFPIFNVFLFFYAFTCLEIIYDDLQNDAEGITRCDCKLFINLDDWGNECTNGLFFSLYSYNGDIMTDDGQVTFECDIIEETLESAVYNTTVFADIIVTTVNNNYLEEFESGLETYC